jgi:hypothetical protein
VVWIPIGAWIAGAVITLVVLGFCAYEIGWKTKRLLADLRKIQSLTAEMQGLQGALAETRKRLAATGLR